MSGAWQTGDGTSGRRIFRLDSSIRPYAWGSVTAIPELLGQVPTGEPAAELWLGAHPDEPSRWREHPDRTGLDELIAADPVGLLGRETSERFGGRLPFMLKLLAADKALSIQVHPTIDQARKGFADEEARGVPRDAPERNYRDDNHKPELLCALTDFQAFSGFRPVAPTVELLGELIDAGADLLRPYRALLTTSDGLQVGVQLAADIDRDQPDRPGRTGAAGRIARLGRRRRVGTRGCRDRSCGLGLSW